MTSLSWRFFVLAPLAFLCRPGMAQVRVWQGTLSLPVYQEELPDPNPPFDQLATNRFNYPYPLRTHLTGQGIDKVLRAIFLENEYLKCAILPDLGGHLYTCTDKINGQPMFYANPSIKKANVGYRGAWAAFGMEFNFPVSHNWVSLSPVDFAFAQHKDGSGSVTVGNIDRVYGMQWSVEMRLRPKSAVLEQRVTLSNPSEVRHRFYWWNNAAIQVWDDSHIEYPMRFAASHGFKEVQPWPVDSDGRDLSIIRNQTAGPVSLFVDGSREPFMGVWNSRTNCGTAHFAHYEEVPGKKIWSWGTDADGLDWRKTLSDNNSAYVEVQSGLFRNQETYAFLEPAESIQFSEYWMPVRDIGGITRANLTGVLDITRRGENLVIGFNANQPIPGVKVSVAAKGNHEVWSTHANLAPERAWSHEVHLPDRQAKYTVEIRDRGGSVLMRQTEDEYDWTPASEIHRGAQASYQIPAEQRRREDDWIQLGETQERNGNLLLALETYAQLVQRFPESYSGLKAAGRLSAALLRFEDAVKFLEPVHSRNTTDAEAAYYLGLAYDGIGLGRKSREALENAYLSPGWRAAAALRLGELSGREKDLKQAEHYFREALRVAPDELQAGEELVAIERALGKAPQARMLAHAWLRRFPLSYFLRNELGMVDVEELANDDNRVLNIAREYLRIGIDGSALEVLSRPYHSPVPDESEPGALPVSGDPRLAYFRAYCREKLGQSGAADRRIGSSLATAYVFPNSADDLRVLRAAVQANPADGNAHYLLGTLYFSRGLTDLALAEWKHAQELNPKIPVLDASIGRALLHAKNDAQAALDEFREGIRNDSENQAVYVGADQALSLLKKTSRERVEVLELYPDPARMPAELVFELALNLTESGDFDRAAALFRHRFIPREEGGTNVRQVWVEVKLQQALKLAEKGDCAEALAASQKLGSPVSDFPFTSAGLEPFVNSARTTYLLGKLQTRCGKTEESRKRFQIAATKTAAGEVFWAWLSAKELADFDPQQWTPRLRSALEQASEMAETSSLAGWWVYNSAMLNRALGHGQQAEAELQQALLLPDRLLSYHLAREALAKQ
jgi:tetratricopeptide (TPR) repeat protein